MALSSGTEIPIPSASYETVDYKSANDYAEDSEKDTPAKYVRLKSAFSLKNIIQTL